MGTPSNLRFKISPRPRHRCLCKISTKIPKIRVKRSKGWLLQACLADAISAVLTISSSREGEEIEYGQWGRFGVVVCWSHSRVDVDFIEAPDCWLQRRRKDEGVGWIFFFLLDRLVAAVVVFFVKKKKGWVGLTLLLWVGLCVFAIVT
ncbi:hypothetical protein AABB24_031940, partial [Solanum stoloniferum]